MQHTLRQNRYNISTFLIYKSTIDRHAQSYQMSLAIPTNKVCVFWQSRKKNMQMLSIMIIINVKKYGVHV